MKISQLPKEIREKALEYQRNETNNNTDSLTGAFIWVKAKEGYDYWSDLNSTPPTESVFSKVEEMNIKHYDNTNGSIYKFCEDQKLNTYEFDLIKRIVRCRKKGQFIEDLEKTKLLIDLYIHEQAMY